MRMLKQLIGHQYPKNMNEIIKESIKVRYPFQHFATLIISKKDIIKGISQSKPNNLITDVFGTWLAGFFRAPVQFEETISLNDSSGTPRTVYMWDDGSSVNVFNVDTDDDIGSVIQLGSGVTPATRGDENVETALPTAPEDAPFDTGSGSYAAGSISLAGAITSGGAGTINEVCLFGAWTFGPTLANFLLFHDILVSGEPFVLGDTLTAAYTINL